MISQETETFTPDNLFAATQVQPVVADTLTIAQAGKLVRGSLLDADGELITVATDVYAVLAEDVDTTAAAKDAPVYFTGEFNENALTVGSGLTVAGVKTAARKIGIFIKKNV